jgi:ubiquinone/menaquinone biosynthesis C-methylase UbiE
VGSVAKLPVILCILPNAEPAVGMLMIFIYNPLYNAVHAPRITHDEPKESIHTMSNSTQRFSDRVTNYVRYRPTYPIVVIEALNQHIGLTPDKVIADIGSGTGISTELFLKNGNMVYAVEPNEAMREAAEAQLAHDPRFHSIAATAEDTTLPDDSIDVVTAGQAFHWFDQEQAKEEFRRILRPDGWVVLFWNDRKTDTTPFLRAYEQLLLDYGTDYTAINHRNITESHSARFSSFFRDGQYQTVAFPNYQYFDYEGVKGRLLSSSYAPNEQHPNHLPMLERLQQIFEAHQEKGQVVFEYTTELFFGRV